MHDSGRFARWSQAAVRDLAEACRVKGGGELGQDRLAVPSDPASLQRADLHDVAFQKEAAYCDHARRGQAVREWRRPVLRLDEDAVALGQPGLADLEGIGAVPVEAADVKVAPEQAIGERWLVLLDATLCGPKPAL